MQYTSSISLDRRSRGFAAIAAVFVLMILGLLGTSMVTISSASQRTAAFDVLGARALQAARAGIEFGAYQALVNGGCATTALTLTDGLAGFGVNVQCTSTSHVEVAAPAIVMYQLTATACNRGTCPGSADATYVERQMRTTVTSRAP